VSVAVVMYHQPGDGNYCQLPGSHAEGGHLGAIRPPRSKSCLRATVTPLTRRLFRRGAPELRPGRGLERALENGRVGRPSPAQTQVNEPTPMSNHYQAESSHPLGSANVAQALRGRLPRGDGRQPLNGRSRQQAAHHFWREKRIEWWRNPGLTGENPKFRPREKHDLAHYAREVWPWSSRWSDRR
jgi:hypothetical protein